MNGVPEYNDTVGLSYQPPKSNIEATTDRAKYTRKETGLSADQFGKDATRITPPMAMTPVQKLERGEPGVFQSVTSC